MTRTITTRMELAAAAAVAGNGDAPAAKLRHELLALAMLADIQAQPEHAETIALDFDHWCLTILSASQGELTVRQRALLNALDAYFDELGRQGDESLWSEDAIRDSLEWGDIRGLARQALESFGWRGSDLVLDGDGVGVGVAG